MTCPPLQRFGRHPTILAEDFQAYLDLMAPWCGEHQVEVWAYCLMPMLALARDWRRLLNSAATEEQIRMFREHERTGRVLGDDDFQARLEKQLGRVLRRQKPGPKKATPG